MRISRKGEILKIIPEKKNSKLERSAEHEKAGRESLNIRSAFMHMIGDTASSVGVVIGAVIIYFTGLYIIDSIFSIIIALLILVWAFGLIRDSVRVLMESTPKSINTNENVKKF